MKVQNHAWVFEYFLLNKWIIAKCWGKVLTMSKKEHKASTTQKIWDCCESCFKKRKAKEKNY